jgi:hypothetical protein|mmetsp:Transcript_20696/g.44736  ORF Transcript_20696/g.44736 Transcript_20696/m.44736 type:complete len:220 (+) Transcript_20696:183-842(+)
MFTTYTHIVVLWSTLLCCLSTIVLAFTGTTVSSTRAANVILINDASRKHITSQKMKQEHGEHDQLQVDEGEINRRSAIFRIIAAGTVVAINPKKSTPPASASDLNKADSPASSSSVSVSRKKTVDPTVTLGALSLGAGALFAGSIVMKRDEPTSAPLWVEPAPYGLQQGRNYWNGVELTSVGSAKEQPSAKAQPLARKEESRTLSSGNVTSGEDYFVFW